MQYVVEDSGQVFLFDQEYGLTQEEVSANSLVGPAARVEHAV